MLFKKKKNRGADDGSAEEKMEQGPEEVSAEPEKVDDQDSEDDRDGGDAEEGVTGKKTGKKRKLMGKPKKPKVEKAKTPKTEEYVLKKNTGMRVLRIILWMMLVFIFIKGVISIFQKEDGIDEVNAIISNFRQEFASVKDENEELLSFAQNFCREYLTYRIGEKEDYAERIREYVSGTVYNNGSLVDFKANALCTYINAYRKEEYAPGQYDVYVYAVVEYEKQILNEDGQTYTTDITQAETTMIVPVYVSDGSYIVEDIPFFVEDSVAADSYAEQNYSGGTAVTDAAKAEAVKTSVSNFLTSYYMAEQSVIDYYLASTADRSKFSGLNGRYRFEYIDNFICYQNTDGSVLAIVCFVITDVQNDAQLYQEFNVLLKEDQASGRYYILDMNTRSKNIRMEGEANVENVG